jgi:signal transduction histidine kinase
VVSYLAVPVVSRSGEVLGGLFFGHSRAGVFTERAERVVAGLAAQTAIAMDNARLYEQAQRAVRQRDEFMSIAAHELKTPITTLRGFAQLTLRRLARHQDAVDVDRLQQALQAIDQQSDKLNRLVTQLLDVSRIEAGKLAPQTTPTDLTGLVESITAAAQANTTQHTISIRTPDAARTRQGAIAPALDVTATDSGCEAGSCGAALVALVDPLRIEQVVANLVDNAVKYSPEGGSIEVELSAPDPETVRLAVRDHGIGIPAEHRARIFDRFYQAHGDRFAGIGLGLYVSRQIVELHRGRIEVECPPEGGTRFVVTLPAARVDAPADQNGDPVPAAS